MNTDALELARMRGYLLHHNENAAVRHAWAGETFMLGVPYVEIVLQAGQQGVMLAWVVDHVAGAIGPQVRQEVEALKRRSPGAALSCPKPTAGAVVGIGIEDAKALARSIFTLASEASGTASA